MKSKLVTLGLLLTSIPGLAGGSDPYQMTKIEFMAIQGSELCAALKGPAGFHIAVSQDGPDSLKIVTTGYQSASDAQSAGVAVSLCEDLLKKNAQFRGWNWLKISHSF